MLKQYPALIGGAYYRAAKTRPIGSIPTFVIAILAARVSAARMLSTSIESAGFVSIRRQKVSRPMTAISCAGRP
jgi:hypothetical protein